MIPWLYAEWFSGNSGSWWGRSTGTDLVEMQEMGSAHHHENVWEVIKQARPQASFVGIYNRKNFIDPLIGNALFTIADLKTEQHPVIHIIFIISILFYFCILIYILWMINYIHQNNFLEYCILYFCIFCMFIVNYHNNFYFYYYILLI